MRYVNVLSTRLADALRLSFEPTAAWHAALLSTMPSYSKGPIDIHLGRIPVARLDANTAAELRERLERAINFWRARVRRKANLTDDVGVLRLYVEALSRTAARDDAEAAKSHVRLAIEMGSDEGLNHWWLNEPIGHLLKRAFDAIPLDERIELSPELLRFPLAAERGAGDPSMPWYDPGPNAYRFVRRNGNEAIFDARVAAFLHRLSTDKRSRSEAAVRLLCLHESGQLTTGQTSSFAEALWKGVPRDSNALPEGTNLFSHAFLVAPAPRDIDAHARVYAHLFGPGEGADPVHLVAAASRRPPYIQPNEADALRLFRSAAGWRPKESDSDSLSDAFVRSARETQARMMASILGVVAAPALAPHDRTVENAEAALTFLDDTKLPEALSALPVFYGLNADIDRRIENVFRRTLSLGDRHKTPAAVDALARWLHLSETDRALPLPDVLRDRTLQALERGQVGGLTHLVYLARRLVEAGRCGDHELDLIVEVLDELRGATEYGSPDGEADIESDRVVSLPLVRAECVRLARALEGKGVASEPVRAWRDLAIHDPLPEVRNAAREVAGL